MVIGALVTMAFFFACVHCVLPESSPECWADCPSRYTQVKNNAQNLGFTCAISFCLVGFCFLYLESWSFAIHGVAAYHEALERR